MSKYINEIPRDISDGNLPLAVWLSKSISDFLTLKNEHDVIQYRYGLNGYERLTLDATGKHFEITRERVRQIEKRAVSDLSKLVVGDICRNKQLKKSFIEQLKSYKNSLSQLESITNEQLIVNHATNYFQGQKVDVPLLRFTLCLLGYKPINLEENAVEDKLAWTLNDIDSKKTQHALSEISGYLQDSAIAKSFDEIKFSVNRNKKNELRFNDSDLRQAINLSHGIENVGNDRFQIRYENLASIADKAYRILHNNNEPMHIRNLAIILNKEAFKHHEKSRITSHNIGTRLSSDKRFGSFGRSGIWFLVEWKKFTSDNILDLMEDALHSKGEPLSAKDIYIFVCGKRPVKKKAIDSYLRQDSRFVRIGIDLFALRDWGIPSISTIRERKNKRVFSKVRLCEYIERVFKTKQVNEMFVVDLSQEIATLETRVSPQSIYHSITQSPAVKIANQQQGRMRKIAIFVPNYRSKLSKLDVLTKDVMVGKLIQNTIRKILDSQSDNQLELSILRDQVSKQIACSPASVYGAIENMDDVEKIRNDSNKVICRLIKSVNIYATKIAQIADKQLVAQINRALSLVNIDSVDYALFQIGRIFENTLRKYMLELQNKNLAIVTKNDLEKLNNMVIWAGRTGLITDETALHYLRIERNAGGHGAPAEKDEREALLNNAPVLIQFYVDYIVLLEKRRETHSQTNNI